MNELVTTQHGLIAFPIPFLWFLIYIGVESSMEQSNTVRLTPPSATLT